MAQLVLTAYPATRSREAHALSTIMTLQPNWVEREEIIATRLPDITRAVGLYAARVARLRPQTSFSVSILVPRGQRRPAGFQAAYTAGQLGTDAYLRTVVRKPHPHALGAGVVSWGNALTPFQLDGQEPFWPGDALAPFSTAFPDHLGFQGWLACAQGHRDVTCPESAALLSCVPVATLQAAYHRMLHPFDGVDKTVLDTLEGTAPRVCAL